VILFISVPFKGVIHYGAPERHELVILLNPCSSYGRDGFFAFENLEQIIMSGLPPEWYVGLVLFDVDIINVVAPDTYSRESALHALLNPEYESNIMHYGFFSDLADTRTIVFVTDDELAVLPVWSGLIADTVIIDLISGGLNIYQVHIEYDLTDTDVLLDYDYERDFSQIFSIHLYGEQSEVDKVLIMADNAIDHALLSVEGYSADIWLSQSIAIIETINPYQRPVSIEFSTTGEASASLASMQNIGQSRFLVGEPAEQNLFLNSFFDGAFIPLFASGIDVQADMLLPESDEYVTTPIEPSTQIETPVQQPAVQAQLPVVLPLTPPALQPQMPINVIDDESGEDDIDDYSGYEDENGEENGGEPVETPLASTDAGEPTPTPSEPADDGVGADTNPNLIIFTIIAVLFVLVALILLLRRRKATAEGAKPVLGDTEKELSDGALVFSGKFDIYVGRLGDLPQAYALFKTGAKKEVSVHDILRKTKHVNAMVELGNTENLVFNIDRRNVLHITNNSDCVVFVNSQELELGKRVSISQGESINIVLGDERALIFSPRFLYRM